jgi:hypothetical protein
VMPTSASLPRPVGAGAGAWLPQRRRRSSPATAGRESPDRSFPALWLSSIATSASARSLAMTLQARASRRLSVSCGGAVVSRGGTRPVSRFVPGNRDDDDTSPFWFAFRARVRG